MLIFSYNNAQIHPNVTVQNLKIFSRKHEKRAFINTSVLDTNQSSSQTKAQFTRYALAHVHNTCVVKTARLHDVLCTCVFA